MLRPTELLITAVLLSAGSVAFAQEARDSSDARDAPHLLTESPEYCRHLAAEIEARRSPSADVAMLLREGKRMCDHGHLAGGLVRLRRAFLIVHPSAGEP